MRPVQPTELTVCGLMAVKALFAREPGAIRRLYFDYATGRRIGIICRALAARKGVYRCVEPAELEKIAGTVHHGGIVAVTAAPAIGSPAPEDVRRWARAGDPLLALDRIGNAHNLGAIVRTAAFFGVPRLVIADHPQQALPGTSAYRVAEGGMEHVRVFKVASLAEFLASIRESYLVIGTAVRGASPLVTAPGGAAGGRPVALVLGNEEQGLASEVEAACERRVRIPGSGPVESLNVSAAAAILLHHYFGGRRSKPRPAAEVSPRPSRL